MRSSLPLLRALSVSTSVCLCCIWKAIAPSRGKWMTV